MPVNVFGCMLFCYQGNSMPLSWIDSECYVVARFPALTGTRLHYSSSALVPSSGSLFGSCCNSTVTENESLSFFDCLESRIFDFSRFGVCFIGKALGDALERRDASVIIFKQHLYWPWTDSFILWDY